MGRIGLSWISTFLLMGHKLAIVLIHFSQSCFVSERFGRFSEALQLSLN